ncbi:MAG: hypothetical protein FWD05_00540 [Oscillospiraceae bacterium]|nr:hypothetical protein [Oscillospiraceae bacterium]
MQKIIIDEEFERILPKLDEQTYAWLEENILEYGCREPLVLWDGILIDGHNRYSILQKHDLSINTINMEFDSRDEVLIWIISTQVARRNLNPLQLSFYRGLHYHADKRIVTNAGGKNQYDEIASKNQLEPQNEVHPQGLQIEGPTAMRLAEHYNVSHSTISRDAQLANAISAIGEISPDAKKDILSGKTHITRKQLHELATGNNEDVSDIVDKIVDGRFESGRPGSGSGTSNGGSIGSGALRPWEVQFSKMTDEFRKVMRNHANADDTELVRSALKQYIGMLEELYQSI